MSANERKLTRKQRERLGAVVSKASPAGRIYWLPSNDDLFPSIRAALAHIDAVTAERDRLLLQMDNLRSRISNDAYAMSFKTMGQYRTALLNAFPRPCSICRREDCTTEHACE
jgi:hypothetical protein